MGIRLYCPNGHKLNVKEFLAGRRGICPHCGASFEIPTESTRPSSKELRRMGGAAAAATPGPTAPPGTPAGSMPQALTQANLAANLPTAPAPGDLPQQSSIDILSKVGVPKRPGVFFPPADRAPDATPGAPPTLGRMGPAGVAPTDADDIPFEEVVSADLTEARRRSVQAPPAARWPSSPPDPLAEAPNAVWYVRPPTGGQYGPATSDLMRAWIADGRVSADSLVWREGWRDWQVGSDVFAQLKPDEAVPGLGAVLDEEARSMPTRPGHLGPGHHPAAPPNTTLVILLVLGTAAVLLLLVILWIRS
jgi:hypothetical protein